MRTLPVTQILTQILTSVVTVLACVGAQLIEPHIRSATDLRTGQLRFESEVKEGQHWSRRGWREDSALPVDDSMGVGRRFDGIGGISSGATSKLLVNYPPKLREEILDYLFKPQFGAALQILKVEVGGDTEAGDGTESSHMHSSWDESYNRGYEWWLMKNAKKRNPSIQLWGLPWGFPGWLGSGTQNPYRNITALADYMVRWVQGAKKYHNLTIDCLGIWNERQCDTTYVKRLRSMLDERGFNHTAIVVADGGWGIASEMILDPELFDAVDAIGSHYPGTHSSKEAQATGKKLWASEDFSSFNSDEGAGCWARILNQNYVNGLMTATISWNLIASYYSGLAFFRTGLMTAVEPWSGHYEVNSPIWMSAHTTHFTAIGWEYLKHGAGVGHLPGGGSYVTLVSPDRLHLAIIIETMSRNHSKCVRPFLPEYEVSPQTAKFKFGGSFKTLQLLFAYKSKLTFGPPGDILFVPSWGIQVFDGVAEVDLGVDEVWTLTNYRGSKGRHPTPPPSQPFPLPYFDDFESLSPPQEPFNLVAIFGVYQSINSDNKSTVIRQVVPQTPVAWIPSGTTDKVNKSVAIIGNNSWTDIFIEVEFHIPQVNGTSGVLLATRLDRAGWRTPDFLAIYFFILPDKYIVSYQLARTTVLLEGPITAPVGEWHQVSLFVQNQTVLGAFNKQGLFNLSMPLAPFRGFSGLGTDSYALADFDNLHLTGPEEGLEIMKQYFTSS